MTDREIVRKALLESRRCIDEIDLELVALLNRRAEQVCRIGEAKTALDEPVYQPHREKEIYSRAVAANQGPLEDGAVHRLFERILDEARRLQRVE